MREEGVGGGNECFLPKVLTGVFQVVEAKAGQRLHLLHFTKSVLLRIYCLKNINATCRCYIYKSCQKAYYLGFIQLVLALIIIYVIEVYIDRQPSSVQLVTHLNGYFHVSIGKGCDTMVNGLH